MKVRRWVPENMALFGWLGIGTVAGRIPIDAKWVAWVLAAWAGHTAYSHGLRQSEDAGKPPDRLKDATGWGLALAALIREADALALFEGAWVLTWALCFALYRLSYRRKI